MSGGCFRVYETLNSLDGERDYGDDQKSNIENVSCFYLFFGGKIKNGCGIRRYF